MAFTTGPYRTYTAAASVPDESVLHSSRKIDFAAMDYAIDENGDHEGMDDVAQRVLLTISYAVDFPRYTSDRDAAELTLSVRNSLQFMTAGDEPEISLDAIEISRPRAGAMSARIGFTNLATGTKTSVTVP